MTCSLDTGSPAASFFSPSWPYYYAETPKLWYDPDKAKKEIALSKYPKGFKTTFAVAAGDELNGTIAQIVQANLKVIGIDVAIQSYDPSTLASLVSVGNYDMSPAIGTLDISDPDENVPAAVGEGYGGIYDAYTWYNNPELLKLVHESENTIATGGAGQDLQPDPNHDGRGVSVRNALLQPVSVRGADHRARFQHPTDRRVSPREGLAQLVTSARA